MLWTTYNLKFQKPIHFWETHKKLEAQITSISPLQQCIGNELEKSKITMTQKMTFLPLATYQFSAWYQEGASRLYFQVFGVFEKKEGFPFFRCAENKIITHLCVLFWPGLGWRFTGSIPSRQNNSGFSVEDKEKHTVFSIFPSAFCSFADLFS